MLQISELNDDLQGDISIFFYSDALMKKAATHDFSIVTELFRSYVSDHYCVESYLCPDETVKVFRQLVKEMKKKDNDLTIDWYMIGWKIGKGYRFGASQKTNTLRTTQPTV